MNKVQHDPLFQIFQRRLNEAMLVDHASEDELIAAVVKEYMDLLNGRGFVPPRLYKYLEQDVREEVTHMLKKTTYGYFNFSEYHRVSGNLVNKLKVRGS